LPGPIFARKTTIMEAHKSLTVPSLTALLLLMAAPFAPVGATVPADPTATVQDDELPDKRPEVKEMCATLRGHAKMRGKEDGEAIETIDKLLQEFEGSGPKDRALIVKEIAKCLDQKRGEIEDGVFDNKLFLAAAVSLGEMAPESVKPLMNWVDHKKHRRNLELQRRLIRSLGKTKDPLGIKVLDNMLQHHEDSLVGATAEALGEYTELELKQRKKVFKTMLTILSGAKAAVDGNAADIRARERYDVIAAPIITSLQRLSGHDETVPEKWERWWNKNKKEDWDEAN